MENLPLLSICIPTYNRKKYLKESLDSIINQEWFNEEEIEIVISDNASIDNTTEFVKEYQNKYKNIKYFRNDENIGADRNIIKVLQLWNGKYVWWISDDDIMLIWWLKAVKNAISDNIEQDIRFFQTNFNVLNQDTKTMFKESYLWNWLETKIYKNISELYKSYSYCHNWLSFFSINIFSSRIYSLDLNNIPITQYPHSCIMWLISDKNAIFIACNAIWFRQHNSSIDNIWSFKGFFKIFVIDFIKYKRFLSKNKSLVSQKALSFILFKMIIYSFYLWLRSLLERYKTIIKKT